MQKLTHDDLFSLEEYSGIRPEFRSRAVAHRRSRQLALGAHVSLHFEDRLTMQYQIQEMLRIERIFEPAGIQDELDAYNPLVPDGSEWCATMLIEYPDPEERRVHLAQLIGIEDRVWVDVEGHGRVYAVADEDMERENAEKTSSVHFLRFPLTAEMITAARAGRDISAGIDHPNYRAQVEAVPSELRQQLVADLM